MLPIIILLGATGYAVYEKRKNPSWTPFSALFATPRRLREALDRVRVTSVPTHPAAALDPHMTTEEAAHVNNVLAAETDPAKIHDHADAALELGLPNSSKALTAKAEAVGDAKAAGATDDDVHHEQVAATATAAGWHGETWTGWNLFAQGVPAKHWGDPPSNTRQVPVIRGRPTGRPHVPGPRDLHQQQLDRQRGLSGGGGGLNARSRQQQMLANQMRHGYHPHHHMQQPPQQQQQDGGGWDGGGADAGGGADDSQIQLLQQQIATLQRQAQAAKLAAQTAADAATTATDVAATATADDTTVTGAPRFFGHGFGHGFHGWGRPELVEPLAIDPELLEDGFAAQPVIEEVFRPQIHGDVRRGRWRR